MWILIYLTYCCHHKIQGLDVIGNTVTYNISLSCQFTTREKSENVSHIARVQIAMLLEMEILNYGWLHILNTQQQS